MQTLVKLLMNASFGIQVGMESEEFYEWKRQHWIETEYNHNVSDYWKLPNGNYIVKLKEGDGLDGEIDRKNTLLPQLGAFLKELINKLWIIPLERSTAFTLMVYFTEIRTVCILKKKYWYVLDEASLVGDNLCRSQNDSKLRGIFYGLILAPKIKYCLTINEFGIIEEH